MQINFNIVTMVELTGDERFTICVWRNICVPKEL